MQRGSIRTEHKPGRSNRRALKTPSALLLWSSALGVLMASTSPLFAGPSSRHDQAILELSQESQQAFSSKLSQAQRAFERERYDEAIEALKGAYAIYPHPRIFYKLGQAHEAAAEPRLALEAYRTYLESDESGGDDEAALASIARLEERLNRPGILTVTTTPDQASVYLDRGAEPIGETPIYHELSPGRHTLRIEREGYQTRTLEVNAEAGQAVNVESELTRRPSRAESSSVRGAAAQSFRPAGALSAASGLAGGAAFMWARQRAERIDSALSDRSQIARPEELERWQAGHNRFVGAGWGLLALSAVAGAWSVYGWRVEQSEAQFTFKTTSRRVAVELEVRF